MPGLSVRGPSDACEDLPGDLLKPLVGIFQSISGASWGPDLGISGPLGGLSGPFRGSSGASGEISGPSWGGGLKASVRVPPLGAVLGAYSALLGGSWAVFGWSWAPLGPSWTL